MTCPIHADGDSRIDLNKLTDQDWDLLDFICDGIEKDVESSLDTLEQHMKFLNHVLCRGNFTTRNQQKLQVEQLKQPLGLISR